MKQQSEKQTRCLHVSSHPFHNIGENIQTDWKAVVLQLLFVSSSFFVCMNNKTRNNKTCHHQVSVRPEELLNFWAFFRSTIIGHSGREKNGGFDWTTCLIHNSSSHILKYHLKCEVMVFLLVLYAKHNS